MKSEEGSVLLIVLIVAAILSLLGLTMAYTSTMEFSASNEFENHGKAIVVADGGFNQARNFLRGKDLTTLLSTVTQVPKFFDYSDDLLGPEAGTYASRNPLHNLDARHVNYASPSSVVGTRGANGYLTGVFGETLGTGRFFAKITNNNDGGGPYEDLDGRVYLRVTGIHLGMRWGAVTNGSNRKNSVVTYEGFLRRDKSFDFGSPLTIYGADANPASGGKFFAGNSFYIDGYDHAGWDRDDITRNHNHDDSDPGGTGMSVVYDDLDGGDASTTLETIYEDMSSNQHDNIEGQEGAYGDSPSMQDATQSYRDSENPDVTNIFNPYFMATVINNLSALADIHYTQDTQLSGSGVELGTVENPVITVAEGDLKVSGSGSGAGLLVVKGKLEYQGSFDYQGMILVVGDGEFEAGGANKSIIGGLFVAKLNEDGTYGLPEFTLSGNSNFYFDSDVLDRANTLLSMRILSWREITDEIEPVETVQEGGTLPDDIAPIDSDSFPIIP